MHLPRKYDIELDGIPEWGPYVDVLLNGVAQTAVTSYDCDAGTLCRNKTTENGQYIVDDEEIVREHLHGQVTVQWKSSVESINTGVIP